MIPTGLVTRVTSRLRLCALLYTPVRPHNPNGLRGRLVADQVKVVAVF
jgi:hypothetical protein